MPRRVRAVLSGGGDDAGRVNMHVLRATDELEKIL